MRRYMAWLILGLVVWVVVSCAHAPDQAALKYWKKRTSLDPSGAGYVDPRYQSAARRDCLELRARLRKTHPDLDRYEFDFAEVRSGAVRIEGDRAVVAVAGTARVYGPDGRLVDEIQVRDKVELEKGCLGWFVNYTWSLDRLCRRTLQELAQAQKVHFEQRKVYAGRLEDLAAWFTAPGEVRVSLIHADNKNWRAVA
ncbi:MAG: hypothetical protein AB1896_14785, partial [Thermodesulfobacteriota bacterium]